jgi:glycosyltransferase involved in cell wall biosynthesis
MKEVKNIIILNDFDHINGGAAQVAITSANAFAGLGFRVIFFSAVDSKGQNDLSEAITRYSTGQYDILRDPSRLRALRQGIWNSKAAHLLRSVLKELDPAESVIHLHGWMKALSPAVGKVLAHSGFPVVCTLHDYFAACPNGGFYNYRRKEICTLQPLSMACICTNCDVRNYAQKGWRLVRQAVQWRLGEIPGGIRHFILFSKFSEAILKPFLPTSAVVHLLSNPVTYSLPGRPIADVSRKKLLFVGRLSEEKGAGLACEAATRIGASLVVIGDGPLREQLQAAYPGVEFRGWAAHAEIFGQMLVSTALVFPSVCYETQGLVVPEALSVGLPVIVSDVTAARDFVDGGNGRLFRSGDSQDLAEKMNTLLTDDAGTEALSRYAHKKYWEAPLSFDKFVSDSLSIYRQMLEENNTHNLSKT